MSKGNAHQNDDTFGTDLGLVLSVTKKNLLRHRFFSEKVVVTKVNYILVDYNCKVHSCVSLYLEVLSYIWEI